MPNVQNADGGGVFQGLYDGEQKAVGDGMRPPTINDLPYFLPEVLAFLSDLMTLGQGRKRCRCVEQSRHPVVRNFLTGDFHKSVVSAVYVGTGACGEAYGIDERLILRYAHAASCLRGRAFRFASNWA